MFTTAGRRRTWQTPFPCTSSHAPEYPRVPSARRLRESGIRRAKEPGLLKYIDPHSPIDRRIEKAREQAGREQVVPRKLPVDWEKIKQVLSPAMNDETGGALSLFHPLIRAWFLRSVGRPTEVQERAWPEIARGSHVLVSAPTGTGKTFAAFLWGINQLATGVLSPGKVRILYVSPLKALNNDIQRNLLSPLQELAAVFQQAGHSLPPIRVLTRSGDTSSSERQRMLRHPPEILITTPESLNLILSSPNGRLMLDGVAAVILDEIHAVAATKRGTHLVTAVDRLVRLAGEFQRIALSATVKPLSVVADLVGGFTIRSAGGQGSRSIARGACRSCTARWPRTTTSASRTRPLRRRTRRILHRRAHPARSRCSMPWPGNAGRSLRRTDPPSSS